MARNSPRSGSNRSSVDAATAGGKPESRVDVVDEQQRLGFDVDEREVGDEVPAGNVGLS